MHLPTILRISGLLLMLFSLAMLPPLVVDLIYQEQMMSCFIYGFLATFLTGFSAWFVFRNETRDLKIRDGFVIVVMFWLTTCAFASIPFVYSGIPGEGLTNAMFEAVSGFTTTGATVIRHIDDLPHAMLFYRQWLQFLGGMGIVVLAVAILPFLGVGGMQLFKAEMPGPVRENKLTPRITETAKMLWVIYIGLTFVCASAYLWSGMSVFDAIGASFSTISTGGFFMYSDSLGHFNSHMVYTISLFFILLGATNFTLHFYAIRTGKFMHYWKDEEFRFFIGLLLFFIFITTVTLWFNHPELSIRDALVKSGFTVTSLMTTTGLVVEDFSSWPTFLPIMIMICAVLGGCAGSTTGGVKMLRVLLLHKQAKRELHRLLHPQAVMTLRYDQHVFPYYVLQAIWAFIGAFMILMVILLLALLATGLDFLTAFSAVVVSLANAGAGIGGVAAHCADLNVTAKWLLITAMLVGRLEIFTLLILLMPDFWSK